MTYPGTFYPGQAYPGSSFPRRRPPGPTGATVAAPQHLAVPFQYGMDGAAVTLDQDSQAEVAQSVRVLLSTPTGTRVEQWDYGIPDVTFRDPRADAGVISAAITRWEPRAAGTSVQLTVGADGSAAVTAQIPARPR